MPTEFHNFKYFIENNKILLFFSTLLTIIIYYPKLISQSIGMDTNAFLYDNNGYYMHWMRIGRVGQVVLKKVLWRENSNIFLWSILSIILFILSCILLAYIFDSLYKFDKYLYLILPTLILTSPLFVFQFYFVLQIFEFTLCMLLVIITVYLIEFKFVNIIYRLPICICALSICFGVYNSFVLFFILIASSVQLIKIRKFMVDRKAYRFKTFMFEFVSYGLYCIGGLCSYLLMDKLLLNYYHLTSTTHAVDMVKWFSMPFSQSFELFLTSLYNVIFNPGKNSGLLYYNHSTTLLFILLTYCIAVIFIRYRFLLIPTVISTVVFIVSGIGIIIATAAVDLPRTMVPQFPFMVGIGILWGITFINKQRVKTILILLIAFFSFIQIKDSSNLVVSEKMTFEEDYVKMIEIDSAIKNLHVTDLNSKKVVITGFSTSKNKFNVSYPTELVGVSMFQFGYSDDPKVNAFYSAANVLSIMKSFGMEYNIPNQEEYQKALAEYPEATMSKKLLSCYATDNYIYVNIK